MLAFLHRMRRRLRLVWAWATAAWVAPAVAGTALAAVLMGWLRPWAWPEPAAVGVVVAAVLAIVAWAVIQRLPLPVVARAADRGLATADSFGAALQFADLDSPFGERIRARAEHLAGGARPEEAAPLPPEGRRWAIAAVLGVAALGLAFAPNPQDSVRADQAALQALLDQTADQIDEQAEAAAEQPGNEALASQLRELADEVRQADSLEEAEQALQEAQDALDASRPQNFASQRAAVEGLERSLGQRSLGQNAPSTANAAEQLAAAAESLPELSAEEQAALAERLAALAETQAAGNPELSDALAAAAQALAAGDVAGAQAALGEAALAQGQASAAVASQLSADAAAAQLAQSQANLQGQGQGQGQSQGQGQGQGSGQGQGQGSGQGQGQGSGQGQGQGSGQGQGQGGGGSGGQGAGGGASGQVGGASGGTGSGQGGVGRPGGTDQPRNDANDGATIVDPVAITDGEDLSLGGANSGGQPGEVVGKGDGPTTAGPARVPLSSVVGEYADRATASAQRQQLPPSQQELVGDYFDRLNQ